MPRRKQPIIESTGWEIYQEMNKYIDSQQVIPNEHAFYEFVLRAKLGYTMSIGTYRYWFQQLIAEGLIEVDPATRAVRVMSKVILNREDAGNLSPQD